MTDTAVTGSAPTRYLDRVAATDAARSYKRDLLAALEIEPGHRVLDVGCGPGTDLAALAAAVDAQHRPRPHRPRTHARRPPSGRAG